MSHRSAAQERQGWGDDHANDPVGFRDITCVEGLRVYGNCHLVGGTRFSLPGTLTFQALALQAPAGRQTKEGSQGMAAVWQQGEAWGWSPWERNLLWCMSNGDKCSWAEKLAGAAA